LAKYMRELGARKSRRRTQGKSSDNAYNLRRKKKNGGGQRFLDQKKGKTASNVLPNQAPGNKKVTFTSDKNQDDDQTERIA